MLPNAVGIRRPQHSSSTAGGRASKAKSEVSTLFRVQQTHPEYGSPRYRGAPKSPVDDFIVATVAIFNGFYAARPSTPVNGIDSPVSG
jgi:hypothetical protein